MLLRKARRDLAHHKRPFLALTVMVILGVASLTSIYGAYANLQQAVDEIYSQQNFHDALLSLEPMTRENLSSLDGAASVSAWEARLVVDIPATFDDGEPPVMATVISIPSHGEPTIDALRYVNGEAPPSGTSEVVVEKAFAIHHGLLVGDVVHIITSENRTQDSRVAGIALSPEFLWPAKTAQEHMPDVLRRWGALWMREDALQTLTSQPGVVNQVVIEKSPGASAESAIQGARSAIGDDRVLRSETREHQASNVVLGLLVNAVSQMAFVLPLLFLSIVGLSTYVLLGRLVHQQRANIGLLRALGYQPRAVLVHYMTYAPILAGAGSLIGFAIGFALSFLVTDVFSSYVSIADIPIKLRLDLLLLGFGLSLAFASAASILPAASASRLSPNEAMRPPVPPTGRRSLTERLVIRAPHAVRLGLRNVERHRRRTALTVIGIALAVSVMVIPQALVDSLNNILDVAIVRVQQADEVVILRQPTDTAVIAQVAGLDGVAIAEPIIQLETDFEHGGSTHEITIMGLAPSNDLMRLTDAAGQRLRVGDEGVILSRVFERDAIHLGDTITLYGESTRVLAFTQASGTSGFVSLATAQHWAGTPGAADQVMLKRDDSADKQQVDGLLSRALPVAAMFEISQSIKDARDMMQLYYSMIYLILIFGVIIGAAIVLNTISINVLEESRDFATLRMLGVPTRDLAAQTTTETLALAVPGAVLGLGLGVILSQYFVGIFSSDLFVLDLYLRLSTLVTAFATGVSVALLAQLPGMKQVGRLDLAKATRERVS